MAILRRDFIRSWDLVLPKDLKSLCHLCYNLSLCYHYVIICYLSSESVMSHVTSMFVCSALLPKMRYPELALDVQTPLNQRNSRDKPWQAQNIAKIIYRICVKCHIISQSKTSWLQLSGIAISYTRLGLQDWHSFISFCIWWNCLIRVE